MANNRSVLLLLAGAFVMVAAVFGALHFAGGISSDDAPAVAMNKSDVEKIVHAYLLEHPEVIIEAVNGLQDKDSGQRLARLRDKAKAQSVALFKEPSPIVAGNPNGDVTIVEFFDYRCPYCKKVKKTVAELLKQDGNIRLVLKEFPILSSESEFAAKAAIGSIAQGKYWDFHLALMGAEDHSEAGVFALAKAAGIDIARLKTDMANPQVAKRLKETEALARTLGIDSTPTFFVGDEPLIGAQTTDELKAAVAAARKARPS